VAVGVVDVLFGVVAPPVVLPGVVLVEVVLVVVGCEVPTVDGVLSALVVEVLGPLAWLAAASVARI
jgi:hypothetical protein